MVAALIVGAHAHGQFAKFPDKSIPRTPAGEPDLTAPAPRAADGKPDLTGVWFVDDDPVPQGLRTVERGDEKYDVEGIPRHTLDITADLEPEEVELAPWAAELLHERLENGGIDQPQANCGPTGVPTVAGVPLPWKIVQTPDLVVILYEENTVFRQIFLDGRKPVEDPLPRWMGYSTGRWEGDELVVDTIGVTEESWLDEMGHPHTDSMRVIERFRRRDAGHLAIETTIDDPDTYSKPITYTITATALPDDDLLEYFCTENEKSSVHYR